MRFLSFYDYKTSFMSESQIAPEKEKIAPEIAPEKKKRSRCKLNDFHFEFNSS